MRPIEPLTERLHTNRRASNSRLRHQRGGNLRSRHRRLQRLRRGLHPIRRRRLHRTHREMFPLAERSSIVSPRLQDPHLADRVEAQHPPIRLLLLPIHLRLQRQQSLRANGHRCRRSRLLGLRRRFPRILHGQLAIHPLPSRRQIPQSRRRMLFHTRRDWSLILHRSETRVRRWAAGLYLLGGSRARFALWSHLLLSDIFRDSGTRRCWV